VHKKSKFNVQKIISFTENSQGMHGTLVMRLSCSLTVELIHMCVGKQSQDFSGSLSGKIDLTEVITIWNIREMDKSQKFPTRKCGRIL